MYPLHLLSLSNELLIEVISNLRPLDIHACQCACRRLNKVIVDSLFIQYILHTALSGVFDPLEPGIPLPDRLDALEQWETAWREMDLRKPIASIDAPTSVHNATINDSLVHDFDEKHVITCRTGFGELPSYSFLHLHTWSSNDMRWTTIDVQIPIIVLFAFAPELNLSVAISAPISSDPQNSTVTISPMLLNTGEPHPLASKSKLEITVSRAAARNLSLATVIGDYILYWIGDHYTTLCNIYLVAWKEGWISELRASLPGVYAAELSVISEEIILLVRLREPALELCRLANIGDSGKASLETVCILFLPVLTSRACLRWASCTEAYNDHALFSKTRQQHLSPHSYPHMTSSSGTGNSALQPEGRVGARSRCLRSIPSDSIVNVEMKFDTLSGYHHRVDLVVRRRTLLEFSNPQARVGSTGDARMGVRTVVVLPWETWGPTNSRILDNSSFWPAWLSGDRRAVALPSHITMRDYNPYRVRRALTLLGGDGREVNLACGSMVKVVKEASVYRGGECFYNDVVTSLPYVETVTPYKGCHGVSMDENYMVVEVVAHDTAERKLYFHSLW